MSDAVGAAGTRVLNTYIINQTSHWFIVGLMFPILVLMVLDKGLSIFEAGTVMAIYSGTAVLLELPTGGLADSIGRKKVYILSTTVHILAVLTFLASFNYLTVAVAALLLGLGRALSSGSMDAWFVDEYKLAAPESNLQRALARANVFIPLGLGAGSLIGGLLPMVLGPVLNSSFGLTIFAANLIVVLVADIVQIMVTNAIIKEKAVIPGDGGFREGFRKVPEVISTSVAYGFKNRTVLVLLLVMMAFGFGLTGLELLWQPRVGAIMGSGTETWIFGVLAAAYFGVTAVGSAVVSPVCNAARNNYNAVMVLLMLLLGALILGLSMQGGIVLFAAFYLTVYMVIGMTNSPYAALYNDQVPAEHRSTMLSFQSLLLQSGGLLGSVVLGYVAGAFDIPTAWTISSIVVAGSSAGFVYLWSKARRPANGSVPGGPSVPKEA